MYAQYGGDNKRSCKYNVVLHVTRLVVKKHYPLKLKHVFEKCLTKR